MLSSTPLDPPHSTCLFARTRARARRTGAARASLFAAARRVGRLAAVVASKLIALFNIHYRPVGGLAVAQSRDCEAGRGPAASDSHVTVSCSRQQPPFLAVRSPNGVARAGGFGALVSTCVGSRGVLCVMLYVRGRVCCRFGRGCAVTVSLWVRPV